MGLTAIKARTFYWVSQLGMLAGTIAYVNAGTQLAKIDSLRASCRPRCCCPLPRSGTAAGREEGGRRDQGAPRLRELEEARALRPQTWS